MKNQNLINLMIQLTLSIFLLTSTIGLSQTKLKNESSSVHEISTLELRVANQIFVEHKTRKLVIEEQQNQIDLLNQKTVFLEDKSETLEKVIDNKDKEITTIKKQSEIEKLILKDDIKHEKRLKTKYKLLTGLLAILSIVFITK